MKIIVVKLDLQDGNGKEKQKALKAVSTLQGIDSIAMNMKEKKLTVVGAVDPVDVVSKLRKFWPTADIFSVGPAKEPEKEKKEEPQKEETKNGETKEEEPKKEETKKEEGEKKMMTDLMNAYKAYYPHLTTQYYVQSAEENPNSCAIL